MRALPAALLSALILFTGCGGGGGGEVAMPEGWEGSGDRYWRTGADTSGAFPALDSLESMGINYGDPDSPATQRAEYLERNLKRRLIVLFRTNPPVVDSLFQARVTPLLADADLSGSLNSAVDALEPRAQDALTGAFRQPRPTKRLGTDIAVPFPDSLRESLGGARVRTQVRLDTAGTPVAVRFLEEPHPTLRGIALDVISQQSWSPVYVLEGRQWRAVPGWVRYNVLFGRPPADDAAE